VAFASDTAGTTAAVPHNKRCKMTATITQALDPRFTLRKMRTFKAMSDETLCYTATLYVDGVKTANCENRGNGAPDEFDVFDATKWKEFSEVAKTDAEFDFDCEDQLIGRMLHIYDVTKQMKGWLKKAVIFRLEGDGAGVWRRHTHLGHIRNCRLAVRQIATCDFVKRRYGKQITRILASADEVRNADLDL
jgi:hypothetical protein